MNRGRSVLVAVMALLVSVPPSASASAQSAAIRGRIVD
jgi:hypothetical protein